MRDRAAPAPTRDEFPVLRAMATRWNDDDRYGHVNNVVHYSYFDTAVNGELMERLGHDVLDLPARGLVVETACRYLQPIGFPDRLEIGVAVERLGTTSITYEVAVFRAGEHEPASYGSFTHVYVDPTTDRPVTVPEPVRSAVADLVR